MDDDRTGLENLSAALSESGHTVIAARDGPDAIRKLQAGGVDVVVSDIRMPGLDGFDVLDHVARNFHDTAVILVTGFGTIESAVDAVRRGAYDYLTKPIDIERLDLLIEKALRAQRLVTENVRLRRELTEKYSFGNIVGRSPEIQRVFAQIEQVARTSATVLIRGESGVGKELIASAIHFHSGRSEGPLVKVNCVALAEGVIESELFGHEKGAFTGAHRARRGRIELADGGTLFLDEIGDLTTATQLKLLRVLQEREIERVGSATVIPVDIRLIVATNKDLEQEVAAGRFREELYYRIRVVTIDVPALRDRREDIQILVDHFVALFDAAHGKNVRGMSPQALRKMTAHSWPGIIRELRNCVESLVVMSRGEEIAEDDLPSNVRGSPEDDAITIRLGGSLDAAERQVIVGTLRLADGNKARAARLLGIGKKTLYRKLCEYGLLPRPDEEGPGTDEEG